MTKPVISRLSFRQQNEQWRCCWAKPKVAALALWSCGYLSRSFL